ncbi:MAG: hypothetical protein JOZ41_08855 [Chloroflexi bacterium]|nr:hypothetical protein [Chloroflexota bacterium]
MHDYSQYLDDYDDEAYRRPVRMKSRSRPGPKAHPTAADVAAPAASAADFHPTFAGSRHEHAWISTYLGPFYRDHLISDVLRQVKGGKEATVYCCRAHPDTGLSLVAAKVYRPRMFRNLRNDAQYRQGRDVLSADGKPIRARRELLAVRKGTRFGKELTHTSWLAHEYYTMRLLAEAGADVPAILAFHDNAMLMEYMGDEEMPAPTLDRVSLPREEAAPLFARLMRNVELMLASGRIHGDLSAYNVLYWEGDIRIIDFPQAVDPFANPDAYSLFLRDVTRLCQYFARQGHPEGTRVNPNRKAREIWDRVMPVEEMELQRTIEEFAAREARAAAEAVS